jgi:hypothetical protein
LKIAKSTVTSKVPTKQSLIDKTLLKNIETDQDIDMQSKSSNQEDTAPNYLNQFIVTLEMFNSLPKFIQTHLMKLAKKNAILKCKLHQFDENQKILVEHQNGNTIPHHMVHQKKLINKFTNPDIIHKLTQDFILAEYTKNEEKIEVLNYKYSQRYTELSELLKPINQRSKLLENNTLDFNIIIDTLIEREFCTMLLKQQDDQNKKRLKKEKFETIKAKNEEIVILTVKDLNKIKKDIKLAKKTTSSKKNSNSKRKIVTNSKNFKGKNDQKKSSLPKQKGKTSNDSKKGGNSRNSNVTRQ